MKYIWLPLIIVLIAGNVPKPEMYNLKEEMQQMQIFPPDYIKLEKVRADDILYEKIKSADSIKKVEIPVDEILVKEPWNNGTFYICRTNECMENNAYFYDITAVYEENGIYRQVAVLEENNAYYNYVTLEKYDNTLGSSGLKVSIPVGANAQDIYYFSRETHSYPKPVFILSALDTAETDLDRDGEKEIVVNELAVRIYDKDEAGYFYYSAEINTKYNYLSFDDRRGYYTLKNREDKVLGTYSVIKNDELRLDTDNE